jgi:hypothetical protein
MTTKPPKAKIIKAHKLADELLALWQTDVRPWYRATDAGTLDRIPAETVNMDLYNVVEMFRTLRNEVEA